MLRWPAARERGASALEYAGLIVLCTVVLSVIWMGLPLMREVVPDSLCRMLHLKGCEGFQQDKKHYTDKPAYCVAKSHEETVGGEVDLGFFSIGSEQKYTKETLSDDSVMVTIMPDMEIGKDAAPEGIEVDFGSKSPDEKAESQDGIRATLATGNTYRFKNEQEFQKFKEDIEQARRENMEDTWGGDQGYQQGRALGSALGMYEPPDLPHPYISTSTVGVKANMGDDSGLFGGDDANLPEIQDGDKLGLKSGKGWELELEPKMDYAKWYDEKDQGNVKTAKTYSFEATGNLGIDALASHAEGEVSWKGATRIMRNEDGSLKNIRYTTTAEGAFKGGGALEKGKDRSGNAKHTEGKGQSVTQSVQIDFDTPKERKVGERMLEERKLLPPKSVMKSMVNPLMDKQDGGDINEKPGAGAPDWEKLFYKRGRVWQYQQGVNESESEYGFKARVRRMQFGASFGWANKDARTHDAQILRRPKNGKRVFVDYSPCVADEEKDGS